MKDYYEILEVSPSASQDEIKSQWKLMLQAWHPDKFPSPKGKVMAEEKKQANQ